MGLSLEELLEQGQGRDIFPPRAFFALRSAPYGIYSALVIYLQSQWGCPGFQNCGYSRSLL